MNQKTFKNQLPATSYKQPTNHPTNLTYQEKLEKYYEGNFYYQVLPKSNDVVKDDKLMIAHIDAYGVWY